MWKRLKCKQGEMYIDSAITVLLIVALLLFAMSVMSVVSYKNTADAIADQLLEAAVTYGDLGSGSAYATLKADVMETYGYTITEEAVWFNKVYKRVQLGDPITITVQYSVRFGGFGVFVTVPGRTVRTGSSEFYWN